MNPVRFAALRQAYFRPADSQKGNQVRMINGKRTEYVDFDEPITEQRSLAEYFRGGS